MSSGEISRETLHVSRDRSGARSQVTRRMTDDEPRESCWRCTGEEGCSQIISVLRVLYILFYTRVGHDKQKMHGNVGNARRDVCIVQTYTECS